MYGTRGQSWIALGDSAGSRDDKAELIWRFRELCDRSGARPAFYQVRASTLPLHLDVGLIPVKRGPEAPVRQAESRSDERHDGKEDVSTCKTRGSPYNANKHADNIK